ncbi:MAG: hypothetical protein DMG60_14660, partial [Acidobacteria bacterium]
VFGLRSKQAAAGTTARTMKKIAVGRRLKQQVSQNSLRLCSQSELHKSDSRSGELLVFLPPE